MSYIGKINAGGTAYNVGSTLYGTCETAADTAAKVAVINGFDTLETGVTVHIKFTYSNTASSPTLAIKTSSSATSTTTAKSIKKCGTTAPGTTAATSWQAGAVVSFTYDGTNWQMNDHQDGAGADSDEKVKQSPVSTNGNYELLLSNSANNNEETNKVGKDSGAFYNPSLKAVTFGNRLNNSVTGSYSSARGYNVYASGSYAHAEGNTSGATGESSHAEGYNAQATGTKSHAEGESTTASGNYSSHAEGRNTTASGSYGSHAEGNGSTASADCAHAEGSYATASGNYSHAEGNYTTAQRKSQHVFGEYNVLDTTGANGTVRGSYVEIVGNGTGSSARSNARTLDWSGNETLAGKLTVGTDPTANMDVATKQYVDNKVTVTSVAGKTGAVTLTASDVGALASTTKYAGSASAGGSATSAEKLSNTSKVGDTNKPVYFTANGVPSAISYTIDKSVPSNAVFTDTNNAVTQTATTTDAAYELLFSATADNTTRTEGARKCQYAAVNPSKGAFTFGSRESGSTVGSFSIAEGARTIASGNESHAEGFTTTASNDYSHAEGHSTTASGSAAHSEGENTQASGDKSHAEGLYTIANHRSQHVFGEYNVADTSTATSSHQGDYIEIVGNGTSSARANARTLDWDGNEWLAGGLTTNGNVTFVCNDGSSNTVHMKYDGTDNSLTLLNRSATSGGNERYGTIDCSGLAFYSYDSDTEVEEMMQMGTSDIYISGTGWDGTNASLKTAVTSLKDIMPITGSNSNYSWIKFPGSKYAIIWGRKTATYTGRGSAQSITLNNYPFTLTNPVAQVTGNLAGVVDTQVLYVNTTGTNAEVYVKGSATSNVTATLYVTVCGTYS